MPEDTNAQAPYVLESRSGPVLWLTLNRPEQRNPLSVEMIEALHTAVKKANSDSGIRAIVLAAKGPVFCAGHDLKSMGGGGENNMSREAHMRGVLTACANMMKGLQRSPKAIIACVQGIATAAGCQLVSSCDLAIASDEAGFCTPGVNIGTFCTTPLVAIGRKVNRMHAMELALTGDVVSAEDAVRYGLINRAVPAADLAAEVEALAQKIAAKSAQSIRAGKEAFYRQLEMPVDDAYAYAIEVMIDGSRMEDAAEGTRAFIEKRKPSWGEA